MEDQRPKTIEHIAELSKSLKVFAHELHYRSLLHDQSKLYSPEREIFNEYTPKLQATTYGSDEYKKYLSEMKVGLDRHYAVNRHHPEHFKNGINGMNLVDLVEMFCDWLAATKRHADGDISRSIELNQKRFEYSDDLKMILQNTVDMIRDK